MGGVRVIRQIPYLIPTWLWWGEVGHNIDRCISITPYWKVRGSITVHDGLLLYNQHIVVPRSLQRETLDRIHEGHQGIERCRMRTKTSVWWPGISSQITTLVENCPTCVMESKHRREPLMTTKLPEYPWQVLATGLFELKGDHYCSFRTISLDIWKLLDWQRPLLPVLFEH